MSHVLALVGSHAALFGSTDVSRQPIGPIFKGKAMQETA